MHDALVATRAARRSGSANSKSKADVNLLGGETVAPEGHGASPSGYKSSVIWRGGGRGFWSETP